MTPGFYSHPDHAEALRAAMASWAGARFHSRYCLPGRFGDCFTAPRECFARTGAIGKIDSKAGYFSYARTRKGLQRCVAAIHQAAEAVEVGIEDRQFGDWIGFFNGVFHSAIVIDRETIWHLHIDGVAEVTFTPDWLAQAAVCIRLIGPR
ncbi:MAG: hypothetical protein E1N59_2825 [Puniceicoccaceae bacterium 5H]|nr:MAG: hypothetical protein E1N59_2825 [Puniceicoccaceae bacterium 5H]